MLKCSNRLQDARFKRLGLLRFARQRPESLIPECACRHLEWFEYQHGREAPSPFARAHHVPQGGMRHHDEDHENTYAPSQPYPRVSGSAWCRLRYPVTLPSVL